MSGVIEQIRYSYQLLDWQEVDARITAVEQGGPGGAATWGTIAGTLSAQTDLAAALAAKADASALSAKADASAMTTALAAKADASAMTTALAAKADASAMTTALAAKADASAMTSALAAKADSSALSSYVTSSALTSTLTSYATLLNLATKLSSVAAYTNAGDAIGFFTGLRFPANEAITGGVDSGTLNLSLSPNLLLKGSNYFIARKTADETVTNSAVLQDDDHLAFSVGANEIWRAEFYLFFSSATTTPKFKFDFTGPASPVLVRYHGQNYGGFTHTSGSKTAFSTSGTIGTGTNPDEIILRITVVNGANAGTVRLRWAQNTQTNEATVIAANSHLVAVRLA